MRPLAVVELVEVEEPMMFVAGVWDPPTVGVADGAGIFVLVFAGVVVLIAV